MSCFSPWGASTCAGLMPHPPRARRFTHIRIYIKCFVLVISNGLFYKGCTYLSRIVVKENPKHYKELPLVMYQTGFQKYLVLIGVVSVFVIHYCAGWIQSYYKLEKQERDVRAYFKSFKIYEDDVYFPSVRVAGPDGGIVDLSWTGWNYTILNVWATWCAPCVSELPSLKALDDYLEQHGNGWQVIAVSIDSRQNIPKVAAFTEKLGVGRIASYHDYNYELQKAFNVSRLPTTFIINRWGRILYEIQGDAPWVDKDIRDFLETVQKVK